MSCKQGGAGEQLHMYAGICRDILIPSGMDGQCMAGPFFTLNTRFLGLWPLSSTSQPLSYSHFPVMPRTLGPAPPLYSAALRTLMKGCFLTAALGLSQPTHSYSSSGILLSPGLSKKGNP